VISEAAENAGFGAGTAAPIARKVLDAYLLGDDGKLKPQFEPSAQAKARLETQPAVLPAAPAPAAAQ